MNITHFQQDSSLKTQILKYSKVYSSDGGQTSKKWMAYVIDIVRNWNFVDTKLIKPSLTRLTPIGFKRRLFKRYTTFYTSVKFNSKKSRKIMKKN